MAISTITHGDDEYLKTGEGPGVVLVHGTAGDARTGWQPVMEALAGRFTVLAPNLPGSGGTSDPGAPLELASVAEGVLAAAEHAQLASFHLVGYSLGAAVATELAGTHAARVRSLLVAGWLRTDAAMRYAFDLWRRLFDTDRELFARFVLYAGMSGAFFERLPPVIVDAAVAQFMHDLPEGTPRQVALDANVELTRSAAAIVAPTRVVGLTDDLIVPIHHARALAAAIPGAELQELAAGHLMPWEQPERFIELVAGSLRDAASDELRSD